MKTNGVNEGDEREGIWQLDREIPDIEKRILYNNQYTFIFQQGYVIISLLSESLTQWKSPDDVYKLKSKWIDDTLYYLPPFGDWMPLAEFGDGVFFIKGSGKKRIFKKIAEENVASWNKALLMENRVPHNYDIQPDGTIREH